MKNLKQLLQDESGATAIEYGLIAALISVATVGTLGTVGTNLTTTYQGVGTALTGASSGGGGG